MKPTLHLLALGAVLCLCCTGTTGCSNPGTIVPKCATAEVGNCDAAHSDSISEVLEDSTLADTFRLSLVEDLRLLERERRIAVLGQICRRYQYPDAILFRCIELLGDCGNRDSISTLNAILGKLAESNDLVPGKIIAAVARAQASCSTRE